MVGSDAAPAALPRKQGLGRPRDPPVRHYALTARSSLDWDWLKAANGVRGLVPGSADLGRSRRAERFAEERRDGAPAGASLPL
jgi:hypothetical protein